MIIRWKNCTPDNINVFLDHFSGKPDYAVRPGDEAHIELPDDDDEFSVQFTIHQQVRGRVVFMTDRKKKPKPKA